MPALFSSCWNWGVRRFAKHMSEILPVNRQLLVLEEKPAADGEIAADADGGDSGTADGGSGGDDPSPVSPRSAKNFRA